MYFVQEHMTHLYWGTPTNPCCTIWSQKMAAKINCRKQLKNDYLGFMIWLFLVHVFMISMYCHFGMERMYEHQGKWDGWSTFYVFLLIVDVFSPRSSEFHRGRGGGRHFFEHVIWCRHIQNRGSHVLTTFGSCFWQLIFGPYMGQGPYPYPYP